MESYQEKGCLERIREIYTGLNEAEKKVAKCILENPVEIIHYSITELAESSDVSEATVSRLCKKLRYKGYQQLKIHLAGAVLEPMQNIHQEIKENDDMYIIMQKVLNSNIASLQKTAEINDSRELDKATDLIIKAGLIMFFGMGGSGSLAHDAYHKFVRTGISCTAHTDSHWQAMYASMAKPDDVIIAFSNSGSNKDMMESIEIAKKNKVKTILITGNGKSPIAKISDIVLVSYGEESMFRSEAMESRMTALMLVDCLYVSTAMKMQEATLNTLQKIREGIAVKRF